MKNSKFLLGVGVAATIPLVSSLTSCKTEDSKPNIIFILVDDMGYADLGCYGSTFYETPNIDRLAGEGIRFTNAYASCPVSSPTRAAIMTGLYPVNTGITDWIPGRQATRGGAPDDKLIALPFRQQLELEEITIAEILKNEGYATMISGKWHLGRDPEYWPEFQGFDVNSGGHGAGAPTRNNYADGYFSPYGNPKLTDGPPGEYLTDRQTDEALEFIGDKKNKPFFVFLSYYAVHNPMQAKEEHILRFTEKAEKLGLTEMQPFTREIYWIRELMGDNYKERVIQSNPVYAAMIYSLDENIGRVLGKISEMGIEENTVVIFTSDNGGLSTSEGSPTCNYPLRAGKGWLYEGGIRVPLIIKTPFFKRVKPELDCQVSSVDFLPTIAEIAGTTADIPGVLDGVSIVHTIKTGESIDRPLFWHYPHYSNQGVEPGSAIRLGKFKLIDNFESGKQELYDLENDISESTDISESEPAKTLELFSLLNDWREKTGAKMMEPNPKWYKLKMSERQNDKN
ncbi:MAG: sulfatase [Bacteroidales bacterium]|nr:sulfatase [Bacteroidales bacterium]